MRFLIAGFGSIGRRHLRNLTALGERDIVLYRTRKSTLPEDELAGFPVETDLRAALDRHPDVVIVSNPTACHLDVAIPAAEQGCSLLIEKPVSHSLERVDDLRDALERSGGHALVGFQFRFHPGIQIARRLLMEDAAGRPLSLRAEWGEYLPNWHPWEDYRKSYTSRADLGGGVVVTLSHPLDYLRWLFGEAKELWAFTGRASDLEIEVEDFGEIGLRYESGLVGSVHLDYFRRPPMHRFEVICSEGAIAWDNADGAVRLYRAATGEWECFPVPEGFDRNELFLAEMRHMIAVAKGEEQPLCTLEDGVEALKLALDVYEASRLKSVIRR